MPESLERLQPNVRSVNFIYGGGRGGEDVPSALRLCFLFEPESDSNAEHSGALNVNVSYLTDN